MAPVAASNTDAHIRSRIGPWNPSGAADLSDFDADTNFVVRAAAGSGKTTSLIARMVALVRKGTDVRSMAAITFTRKAAGEMSERFFTELKQAQEALPDGTELERVTSALHDMQHSFIGTVHAFCGRLLREYPLAVSLPPDFTTGIEDREERELRDKALRRYLQKVHEERPETLAELEEMGIAFDRLPVFFERLCRFPDLKPYTDGPDTAPDMAAAVDATAAFARKCQARRPNPLPRGPDEVMKMLDRARAFYAYHDMETPVHQATYLQYFAGSIKSNGKAKITLSAWGKRGSDAYADARELRDQGLPDLVKQTIQPLLRQWSAIVHRKLMELLWPAVDEYRLMRRDTGNLTHHDLLYFTRELLRENHRVRRRIQQRYRRLLVDEFQDTDPLQAEILFYLTGSNTREDDWRRCTPRPGSLFIVGDDKQSIYRFRRADKGVFDEVSRLVQHSGGELVDLTRNFRSLETLCDWCNEAFAELFAEPGLSDIQAEYISFQAHRPPCADPHGLRRLPIEKVSGNWGKDIARLDADRIAHFIQAAHAGKKSEWHETADGGEAIFGDQVRYSDFLILTRTKTRLDTYADALATRGIPYTITGSEDLGESEELKTLLQLLTCAMRPDDPVAAAAYFRGGLCGFSDDDMYRFRQAGGRFDRMMQPLEESTRSALDKDLAARFQRAIDRIAAVRQRFATRPPAPSIEQIVDDTGLLAGAAHPPDTETASLRAGQVLRALTLVRHLTGRGMDWTEIVEELQRVVDGEESVDGMTLETGSGDAVRIMNVHQAKGLQAPVVFLADPYSRRAGSHKPDLHVRRKEGEVVIPVVEGEGHYQKVIHAPLGWHEDSEDAFCSEEERHDLAQELRLLYVAATRAQNMLVISTYPEKQNKGYWCDLYAHLDRAEVPELVIPAVEEVERLPAPAPDLDATRTSREKRMRVVAEKSFVTATFTGKKGDIEPVPAGDMGGYGRDFGTALHALFEVLIRHRHRVASPSDLPLERYFAQLDARVSGDEVQLASRMCRTFMESSLWTDLQTAQFVCTEYPLLVAAQNGALELRRGSIDLLYRDEEGWHIVDFKSDQLRDEAENLDLPSQHPYVQQVRSYAAAWEDLSEETLASASLFFTDAGERLRVE